MQRNLKMWREAASLILVAKSVFAQANSFNYKVLCLKRSSKSKFMPESYVFPGGAISKADSNNEWLKLYEKFGFSRESFDSLRPVENVPKVLRNVEDNTVPKDLSFRICAIRETFEECGILLCKSPKIKPDINSNWASFFGGHELIKWQQKVNGDSEEFLNLCSHFDIYPDVWGLKNWSNWVTPPGLPRRFNTIFFFAALHQTPTVNTDEREIQGLMWATPDDCISLNNQQSVLLPPPQFYEMSRLRTISDVDALAKFAKERSKYGYETYWPLRIATEEGSYSLLPGDDLYPAQIDENVTETRIEKLTDCQTKHRVLHKSEYLHVIQTKNFAPKCNHIVPYTGDGVQSKF